MTSLPTFLRLAIAPMLVPMLVPLLALSTSGARLAAQSAGAPEALFRVDDVRMNQQTLNQTKPVVFPPASS